MHLKTRQQKQEWKITRQDKTHKQSIEDIRKQRKQRTKQDMKAATYQSNKEKAHNKQEWTASSNKNMETRK